MLKVSQKCCMVFSVFLNDTAEVPHYHSDWSECVNKWVSEWYGQTPTLHCFYWWQPKSCCRPLEVAQNTWLPGKLHSHFPRRAQLMLAHTFKKPTHAVYGCILQCHCVHMLFKEDSWAFPRYEPLKGYFVESFPYVLQRSKKQRALWMSKTHTNNEIWKPCITVYP